MRGACALAGALAGAALAAAGGAHATPAELMLTEFDQACLQGSADPEAVGRAALQGGWMPMPEEMSGRLGAQLQNAHGWIKGDSDGMQVLIAGEQSRALAGMQLKMRACGVGAAGPDAAKLTAGLQARAAVPPSPEATVGGETGWVFRDRAGRHEPLGRPNDAEARTLVKEGSLRFLMVIPPRGGTAGAPTMLMVMGLPPG